MSNILNLKGVKIFAIIVLAVALLATFGVVAVQQADAASCTITATLRLGSTGADVTCLQATLGGLTADGNFGPMTNAAVKAFQTSKSLVADGVVGALTRAALAGTAGAGGGATCPNGNLLSNNCQAAASSGPFCPNGSTLASNCTSSASGTGTGSGTLSGGAGTLDFTTSTSNTEDKVKEGATEKVLAFKAEADGSDIEVTNVKVQLSNLDFAATSERLTDYVDSVSIWMGDEKVGEDDASDFSKDSGSPDTYTKTITLSNAVVRDGVKATFYVALTAQDSIDTTDMATADWKVDVDTVRYTDATGIVLSEPLTDTVTLTNGFEDASVDDDISIKSSSSNPVASTLLVDANTSSEEFLVGAFKLDVDDLSADVDVTSIPVYLEIAVNTTDTGGYTAIDSIVDQVRVKVGSDWFDADLADDDATTNTDFDGATGSASYLVTLDSGELTIDSGTSADVKVYVTFNEQTSNYIVGTTVVASVVGADIDAETSADDVAVTGSFTGKTHTLSVDAPTFSLISKSFNSYQAIDGVASGEEDVFKALFTFNVAAADEDVYLSKGMESFDEASYNTAADEVQFTQTNGGTLNSATLDADDSSLDDGLTSSFLITAGSTEKFTLSFYVRANNNSATIAVDSFAYGTSDDTATQYDYDSVVNTGLSAFVTNSTYLAK